MSPWHILISESLSVGLLTRCCRFIIDFNSGLSVCCRWRFQHCANDRFSVGGMSVIYRSQMTPTPVWSVRLGYNALDSLLKVIPHHSVYPMIATSFLYPKRIRLALWYCPYNNWITLLMSFVESVTFVLVNISISIGVMILNTKSEINLIHNMDYFQSQHG